MFSLRSPGFLYVTVRNRRNVLYVKELYKTIKTLRIDFIWANRKGLYILEIVG